jgi:hypothetical protein
VDSVSNALDLAIRGVLPAFDDCGDDEELANRANSIDVEAATPTQSDR